MLSALGESGVVGGNDNPQRLGGIVYEPAQFSIDSLQEVQFEVWPLIVSCDVGALEVQHDEVVAAQFFQSRSDFGFEVGVQIRRHALFGYGLAAQPLGNSEEGAVAAYERDPQRQPPVLQGQKAMQSSRPPGQYSVGWRKTFGRSLAIDRVSCQNSTRFLLEEG